ncbi:AraC family transcriptional regulator [Gracilibacillus oryzae]|uniref:AraC family transcriptional regulator n=1 Tax=Gracilibacillus oryzae TaxID=1672701 RepID=A0A7C8L6C2_9BACI|nr:AraC family transcriptional regulator [Gracilibacillus oryzae]KAB8131041.1 AraC family transcriptional regulator [Gracilibacillus oryzae]
MLNEINLEPFGIKLYESKHSKGDMVENHHHVIYQLLYALEGTGEIILDGEPHPIKQDYMIFIKPFTPHTIISDKKLTILVLAFDKRVIDNAMYEKLALNKTKIIGLNPFDSSEIRQILRALLYEQTNETNEQELALKIFLSQLLLLMVRGEKKTSAADANALRADRLKEYIDSHYYEWIHAEDLATRLGISTRHMNTIFKESYQLTPIQYLTEVRIGLAKKMLAETDKDIASICFEAGFESISTFYRAFKNIVSISPNKYRTSQKKL